MTRKNTGAPYEGGDIQSEIDGNARMSFRLSHTLKRRIAEVAHNQGFSSGAWCRWAMALAIHTIEEKTKKGKKHVHR